MRFTPSYAMTPYTRSELHMTSDEHQRRNEDAARALARSIIEDPDSYSEEALTDALRIHNALALRRLRRAAERQQALRDRLTQDEEVA